MNVQRTGTPTRRPRKTSKRKISGLLRIPAPNLFRLKRLPPAGAACAGRMRARAAKHWCIGDLQKITKSITSHPWEQAQTHTSQGHYPQSAGSEVLLRPRHELKLHRLDKSRPETGCTRSNTYIPSHIAESKETYPRRPCWNSMLIFADP